MNGPIWWLNATAYGHADFLVNYYITDKNSDLHIRSMKLINNCISLGSFLRKHCRGDDHIKLFINLFSVRLIKLLLLKYR